jgi:hypothetical protein
MALHDYMAADMAIVTGTDDHGETVTYRPYGGTARSITAIVERDDETDVDVASNVTAPLITITVANSATAGISATEIKVGADQIDVADRPGKTATSRVILRIIEQDKQALVLEVR